MHEIKGDSGKGIRGQCSKRLWHSRNFNVHEKGHENAEVALKSENVDISVDHRQGDAWNWDYVDAL